MDDIIGVFGGELLRLGIDAFLLLCVSFVLFGNWPRLLRRNLLGTYLMEYLGTLAKLGLPLTQGLGSCSRKLSRRSRQDVRAVEQNLQEGMLLGDALVRVPRPRKTMAVWLRHGFGAFQPYPATRLITPAEAETLRIGEMSGNLDKAFGLVMKERRRFEELRTGLFGAFLYPAALLLVAASVLSFIMFLVVPKMAKMYEELQVSLPVMTKWLVQGNRFGPYWPALAPLLVVLLAAGTLFIRQMRRLRSPTSGRRPAREWLQRAAYFIPYHIGAMRRPLLAEFCTELAMLLHAGAAPHRALRVIAEGTMNPWFRDRVRQAAELCEKGESFPAALDRSRLDGRAAWFSRATGDPAELADSLAGLAEDYRQRVSWGAAVGGRLLPPILILCIGAVVAFVVISMFLPLVKLANSLGG